MAKRKKNEQLNQITLVEWFSWNYPKYRKLLTLGSFGENIGAVRMHTLKRMGLTPGYPDLALYLPRDTGEGFKHALFVEMKDVGGKVTPHQREVHELLEENNFAVHVCYTWDEAKVIIQQYIK